MWEMTGPLGKSQGILYDQDQTSHDGCQHIISLEEVWNMMQAIVLIAYTLAITPAAAPDRTAEVKR